jgi:hypothetical protein
MSVEMTATTHSSGGFRRVAGTGAGLLAAALVVAWPGTAQAKKHPKVNCHAAHVKGHKAKTRPKPKRCPRPVTRRPAHRRSTATKPGAQTNATTPASGDDARCRQEQAQDPAGFAELYGVSTEDPGAFDNCLSAGHDTSTTDATDDSG